MLAPGGCAPNSGPPTQDARLAQTSLRSRERGSHHGTTSRSSGHGAQSRSAVTISSSVLHVQWPTRGAVEGGVERGDGRREHPEPLCLGKREPHAARIAGPALDAHDFGAVHHQDWERGSRTWPAVRGQWAELYANLEIVPIDSDHVAEGVIERLPKDPREAPRTDHRPPREEVDDPLRWLEIEVVERTADLGLRRSLREDRRRVHALLREDSAQLIEAYVSW